MLHENSMDWPYLHFGSDTTIWTIGADASAPQGIDPQECFVAYIIVVEFGKST